MSIEDLNIDILEIILHKHINPKDVDTERYFNAINYIQYEIYKRDPNPTEFSEDNNNFMYIYDEKKYRLVLRDEYDHR
jgi:hypothetical protein